MIAILPPLGGVRLALLAGAPGDDRRTLRAAAHRLLDGLADGPGGRSLAYAGRWALAAAAPGRALGVDLAEDRAPAGWEAVAALYLPRRWRAGLDAAGFPAAWARWEAWLKCRGRGLEEEPADDPGPAAALPLLRPAPGLVAALATA